MKQDWEYKKLGDVCKIVGGSTPKTNVPEYWDGKYSWITPAELDGSKYIVRTERSITDLAVSKSNLQLLPVGTVLLSSRAPIGKVAITKIPLYCNQGFKNVVVGKQMYNEFVYWYLVFKKDYIVSLGRGATFKEISKSITEQISIPVPPLSEQKSICSLLDKLSGIIEKKQQQVKELDALAQSIFYDMFGDPVENEKGWKVKCLKEVGRVITGNTPSTRDVDNYSSNDYCFVKPSDIAKEGVSDIVSTEFYISTKAYNNSRKLPKGSVLTTCIGIIGKVGVLGVDATCNQQINAIIPYAVESIYLAFSILSMRKILESIANAPVVPIINKGDFSKLQIPVPPLSLQQSFAAKVEAIENQKEIINQSIREVQTLFDSRMEYYFGE